MPYRPFVAAFCGLILLHVFATSPASANPRQALRTVMYLAAGAEAVSRGVEATKQYQEAAEVLSRLQAQGQDCKNDAIYSVLFQTSAGHWADFWSRPDVFFCLDIEGKGSFIAPNIHWNYSGTPFLDHILAEEAPPGSRIVVRVMDDDTASDAIWNSILSTRVELQATADLSVTQFIPVRATASGALQLLDRRLTIDAPEEIASAVFEVPESADGLWRADGRLFDTSDNAVGTIQMCCTWSGRHKMEMQSEVVNRSRQSSVFWLTVGGGLLLLFLRGAWGSSPEEPSTD